MALSELTFEEFCQKPLTYTMGMRFDDGAQRMYRNEELGIQKETITPFNEKSFSWGESKVGYFLDGDDTTYPNAAALYEAWMRKVCGVKEIATCE